jgi:hypothetical protein
MSPSPVEVTMFLSLSMVLTCLAAPTLNDGLRAHLEPYPLHRVESTAGVVTKVPTTPSPSLRLASERATIPSSGPRMRSARAQLTGPKNFGPATKGMLVAAGIVAGAYAGTYLGLAMDDTGDGGPGLIGMPIGAALGGLIAWQLVR